MQFFLRFVGWPLIRSKMNIPKKKPDDSPIRVFLFAEYPMVLESVKHFVDANRDLIVTDAVTDFTEDDPRISRSSRQSDVAVVFISDSDQVRLIPQLLRSNPTIRVVVAANSLDIESQAEALRLGAVGIVQTHQNCKLLLEAIRHTYQGETWLNQVLLHKLMEAGKSSNKKPNGRSSETSDVDALTPRELQVIEMIGEGLANKEIASRLGISEATVRHHLSSIYSKIGVEDRVSMVIAAHQRGLVSYAR